MLIEGDQSIYVDDFIDLYSVLMKNLLYIALIECLILGFFFLDHTSTEDILFCLHSCPINERKNNC